MPPLLQSLWRWYTRVTLARPLLTQSLSSGVVMALGDATVQCVTQWSRNRRDLSHGYRLDWSRTLRYFLLSALIIGPGLRHWYVRLARWFEGRPAGRMKMLAADQLLAPPVIWLTFLGYTSVVVRGDRSPEAVRAFVLDRLPVMAANSYKVWPLAQAVNFCLVPLHFRLLYVSCVGYFWNCYICWHSNRAVDDHGGGEG